MPGIGSSSLSDQPPMAHAIAGRGDRPGERFDLKRLLQSGRRSKGSGKTVPGVTRREDQGNAALHKDVGGRKAHLAIEIDIEDCQAEHSPPARARGPNRPQVRPLGLGSPRSISTKKTVAESPGACVAVLSRKRTRSAAFANRRRRIVRSSQSGTPAELANRSLVRTLSSLKKASASVCFLAAKAMTGFRSASIVKIESDNGSVISSPSA